MKHPAALKSKKASYSRNIPMAWALQGPHGKPVHVTTVDTGLASNCYCANCSGNLEAVNVRWKNPDLQPHFRHESLPEDEIRCSYLACVIAVEQHLLSLASLRIPPWWVQRHIDQATVVAHGARIAGEPAVPASTLQVHTASPFAGHGGVIFQNGAGRTYAVAVDTEFLEPAPPADGILLLPIDWTKLANYFTPAKVASVVEYALAKLRWITVPDQHSIVDAFLAQEQERTLQRKAEADLEKASVPKPSNGPAGSPASQWTWTGQSASGQAAEDLRSLIVRHYKDGAFRAYGMRVDYWQILSEAKAHAGSSIRVEDAVADWKHRYKLGDNDTTIWRVLTHARAVALRPAK